MRISVVGSVSLHLFILFFTIVSLPLFNNDELEMPPVIQVELIEIAEKTNVPQISKKKEDKKPGKENKKDDAAHCIYTKKIDSEVCAERR